MSEEHCPYCAGPDGSCDNSGDQQLIAASLENKRLRDTLQFIGFGECKPCTTHCSDCPCSGCHLQSELAGKYSRKALSSPDQSALAGLYLELREAVENLCAKYTNEKIIGPLRDILKRIKEQG